MKRKLLSILALLLFVSGAWAQSTITVYATNTAGWSKMSIHYWGDGETEFPGTPMENFYTDGSGLKYYRVTIPADVTGIVFTNGASSGTKQTGDITSGIADGAWWEVNSTTSAGKYGVEYKGIVPHGNCGTSGNESDVTWVLAGTSPNYALIVSGSGAMADYNSTDQPWYSYRTSIKSVIINSGITHIGNNSFYNCSSLTSATLPSSDLTSIGNYAFRLCSNLASITIPDGLTSIGNQAFEGCRISSINIPSSVTSIGFQALFNCSLLSNITVDSGNDYYSSEDGALFDKGKTKIIQYPIAKSGDTYTLPATVTYIYDHAFRNCKNITSFDVPNGVTKIGGQAFEGCTNLASVTISNSVTSIGASAFEYCSKLGTITLNSNPSISSFAFNSIKSGATITMNLAVNKAAEGEYWTTFYNRNYNFEISDAGGQNTQIFKAALNDTKLTLTELGDDLGEDKIITKNKAVILKSTTSPMVFTLTTSDSGNDYDTDNSLSGVSSASGQTANGNQFVLNKGSQGVGFYRMTSGKVIGVGKAYLTYSGALAPEFLGFDETTGINAVNGSESMVNGSEIYNLNGQRVENPTKGLYIVNGKKVVIK